MQRTRGASRRSPLTPRVGATHSALQFADVSAALDAIESITSVDDAAQLQALEASLAVILPLSDLSPALPALFGLLERFPDNDAYGIFWTVLHRIEAHPGYEPALIASLQRAPSTFVIRMAAAVVAGGGSVVPRTDLLQLLQTIADDSRTSPAVQSLARSLLQ